MLNENQMKEAVEMYEVLTDTETIQKERKKAIKTIAGVTLLGFALTAGTVYGVYKYRERKYEKELKKELENR